MVRNLLVEVGRWRHCRWRDQQGLGMRTCVELLKRQISSRTEKGQKWYRVGCRVGVGLEEAAQAGFGMEQGNEEAVAVLFTPAGA